MKREEFKEVLMRQYHNVIHQLIVECERLSQMNASYCDLDLRIRDLLNSAKRDGIDESVVWEIVQTKLPDYYEKTLSCKIAA